MKTAGQASRALSQREPSLARTPRRDLQVLPKRWIIGRTNARNDRARRLNEDHDRDLAVPEGWI